MVEFNYRNCDRLIKAKTQFVPYWCPIHGLEEHGVFCSSRMGGLTFFLNLVLSLWSPWLKSQRKAPCVVSRWQSFSFFFFFFFLILLPCAKAMPFYLWDISLNTCWAPPNRVVSRWQSFSFLFFFLILLPCAKAMPF